MKKIKSNKISIPEMISGLGNFMKTPRGSEDIKLEIKDSQGYNIGEDQIKMALLRLLRSKKIKRRKEDKIYKYYI